MRSPFLLSVLLLAQYGSFAWALAVFTTTVTPGPAPTKQMRILEDPEPRASVTPWLNQVPKSVHLANRADSTTIASPSPTATALGQVVMASTKLSTLPPAICAFGPHISGTYSDLAIWGCSYGYLYGGDVLTFNSQDRCVSSDGRYFCVYTTTSAYYSPYQNIYTGDVELSQGTLISYLTSSSYSYMESTITSTSIGTISAYPYTGYSYYNYYTLTTNTYTLLPYLSLSSTTYSVLVGTYAYYTTTYSASYYTQTYRSYPYSYSYWTSTSAYTLCTQSSIYSLSSYYGKCWTPYSGSCQTATAGSSVPNCGSAAQDYKIQVYNISDLQATITSMTMSLSLSMSRTDTYLSFVGMYTSQTLTPSGASSTIDASPSGYLNLIKSNPPVCVNVLNSTCVSLFNASQRCWSEAYPPGPQMCLCNSLAAMNCSQVCQSTPGDRISYYNWAMDMCSSYIIPVNSTSNATFAATWAEVQNRSSSIFEDLYPFAWNISPNGTSTNQTSHCPSKALDLTSFAINNVLVAIGTWFLGKRTFIKWAGGAMKWLTKGAYGVAGSEIWPAISMLVVGINVFANVINAAMVKRTAGFSSPGFGTLLLLWATRPRVSFLATAIAPIQKEQSMYISVGVSTLLSELMLQTIGGVVMVQTVNFFTKHGYMQIKALQYVSGKWAVLLMYSATLIWIIGISFFYVFVIWKYLIGARVYALIFPALWKWLKSTCKNLWYGLKSMPGVTVAVFRKCFRKTTTENDPEDYEMGVITAQPYETKGWKGWLEQMGLGGATLKTVSQSYITLLLPYVAQWLFWVGLVELYGDRYCLPVLAQMTVVWTIFDSIGVFLSATH